VKLKIAEALQGKQIVLVPGGGGSGVALNKLDVNALLQGILGQEAR
jgi:hypothetical protein